MRSNFEFCRRLKGKGSEQSINIDLLMMNGKCISNLLPYMGETKLTLNRILFCQEIRCVRETLFTPLQLSSNLDYDNSI